MKIALLGGILVIALFGISMFTASDKVSVWEGTQVSCLPNGHENLAMHIHSRLTIVVDGIPELIPTGIGDAVGCMAEVHTHDASGSIHAESPTLKELTLSDFFTVWGKSIEREGYSLKASVGGNVVENSGAITIEDKKDVVFMYEKISDSSSPQGVSEG